MEKPLSICTAIYNIDEKFLRECIESLIADKSEDVEIILGDDCSKNNAGEICAEYAEKDSRIKYIRPEKNGGVSVMRNMMIDAASGRFITFVDGDDVISPIYVKKLLEISKTDYDIVMFDRTSFTDTKPEGTDGKNSVVPYPDGAARVFSICRLSGAPQSATMYGIKNSCPSSVCSKAYRREFLLENDIKFVPGIRKSQDTVFNTQAYFYCKRLGGLEEVLYYYRTNPASICNRYSADFDTIVREAFARDEKNLDTLYGGDEKIRRDLYTYKLIFNITENCRLNIFHKDNPHTNKERKKEFSDFAEREPYRSFLDSFDTDSYDWYERRLTLKLVKKRRYYTLLFVYRHPFVFKLYGRLKNMLKQ